jgi:hypothetical protein
MCSRSLILNSRYPACINRDHREEQHYSLAQNEATVSLAESIQTYPKGGETLGTQGADNDQLKPRSASSSDVWSSNAAY